LFRRHVGYGAQPLYLSPILAYDLLNERITEEQQARDARQEELLADAAQKLEVLERQRTERDLDRKASDAMQAVSRKLEIAPHQHEVSEHEVFADFEAVEARVIDLGVGLFGTGEDSHAKREERVLRAALAKGPNRSIVRRSTWREDLEALSNEMPAFRDAVDVIARAWELSELTFSAPAVPPILLVGPPGVGKSRFCRRLSETLGTGLGWIGMDQNSGGCELRGNDAHWSTSRHGKLFELLALGNAANPLVVLDEIDKAARSVSSQGIDMLGQLYGALEPETARSLIDLSLNVAIDASQVMYVATANSLDKIDEPLLSRFEVISVALPDQSQRRLAAESVVAEVAKRLRVNGKINIRPGCYVVLADYSPRVIKRAAERVISEVVRHGRKDVEADDFEQALGIASKPRPSSLH